MTLVTNHVVSDTGHTTDHNAIATQVNTNTAAIATLSAASSTPGQTLLANTTTPEAHGAAGDDTADDTTAIQAAVNAVVASCIADGTYTCEVVFDPRKTYKVAGALQQGGTPKANAQITIPMGPAGQAVILRLGAAAGPISEFSGTTKKRIGAVLHSTLTGAVYSGTFGKPSVVGGATFEQLGEQNFNTVTVVVDGLSVITPDNPTLGAWNFEQMRQVQIGPNGIQAATNVTDTAITKCTSPHAWGYAMPRLSNNGVIAAGFIYASGYYVGMSFHEHLDVKQFNSWENVVALAPAGGAGVPVGQPGNLALIRHALIENCAYMIAQVDPSTGVTNVAAGAPVVRVFIDAENTSAGAFAEVFSINDPTNALLGEVLFKCRPYGGLLASNALTMNGAANVRVRSLQDGLRYEGAGVVRGRWHEVGTAGEPAYQNAWQYYGSPQTTVAFRLDDDNTVHLKGLAKLGVIGGSIFTLPAGFRPANKTPLYATDSNGAFGVCGVGVDGTVVPNVGSNVYFSLDGIAFRLDT